MNYCYTRSIFPRLLRVFDVGRIFNVFLGTIGIDFFLCVAEIKRKVDFFRQEENWKYYWERIYRLNVKSFLLYYISDSICYLSRSGFCNLGIFFLLFEKFDKISIAVDFSVSLKTKIMFSFKNSDSTTKWVDVPKL